MKIVKDIFITIWLLFFTILLGFVCWDAIMRLTEDKNADSNLRGQISQLNVKIDSLENMIMHGQKPKNTSVKVDANLCELKSQLRLENDDLKSQLKNQLDFIEKKIEHEEKIVDDLKGNITFWFCFVTIVVTIIAIGVPLYNMGEIKDKQKEIEDKQKEVEETQKEVEDKQKEIEEKQKKLEEKQKKVEADLESAMNSYNKMKVQIESMNKTVAQAKQDAYDAEASAEISRIFYMNDTNGMNEAIKAYEEVIEKYSNYSYIENVYLNLGKLKFDTGEYAVALGYYEKAINKNNANEVFYSNRAKCYRKLAENEQDPAKKADYIAKAEEDENTAEELKQKGK